MSERKIAIYFDEETNSVGVMYERAEAVRILLKELNEARELLFNIYDAYKQLKITSVPDENLDKYINQIIQFKE